MKRFLLVLFFILLSNYALANNLFKTSYHDIEFISNNIEDDKIRKIKEIKKKSIINVFKNILDQKTFDLVNIYLSEDMINTFIKNIMINEEKIINNKYLSKIKINFDKIKIINFLREKKFPYVEYYPDKILLILYEKNKTKDNLFTKNNSFYSFFKKNLYANNLFVIPKLDINDRFILNKEHIKNNNKYKILNFSKKYHSKNTVVVVTNKNNNNIQYDLILYSENKIIKKKSLLSKNQFNEFFIVLENEVLNSWKEMNEIQNKYINIINCKIDYFNMFELKEIRNNLKNISVIKDLNIKSFSYKNIQYQIHYYGNYKILSNLFSLNNLKINDKENICSIKLR